MPYSTTSDLPDPVKGMLPAHAEEIYKSAFNNALRQYGKEDNARRVAWAAVKKTYKKGSGKMWVKAVLFSAGAVESDIIIPDLQFFYADFGLNLST